MAVITQMQKHKTIEKVKPCSSTDSCTFCSCAEVHVGLFILVGGGDAWELRPAARVPLTPHNVIKGDDTFALLSDLWTALIEPAAKREAEQIFIFRCR